MWTENGAELVPQRAAGQIEGDGSRWMRLVRGHWQQYYASPGG